MNIKNMKMLVNEVLITVGTCEILGSHGVEYEDESLLAYRRIVSFE
jgi:hypothetical protein